MRATRVALGALLLLALALRVIPWLANLPLHHDEALYGTWARAIADGSDPLLLIPWVDKPPLVLYLLGLSIKLFGPSELSLRVPGMITSILTVLATIGLARRSAGRRASWVAAALVALSPFAILFAPTAFTDGWLTLFFAAAAWAALARRPGWAGVLLGLACASKQQGVMAIPLVLALLVVGNMGLEHDDAKTALEHEDAKSTGERDARTGRSAWTVLGVAVLGFVVVFGAVTYWDSLRWHNRPSYWDQSLQTYGGVVLAPVAEWPARAGGWARQAGYWFGAWPVTAVLLGAAFFGAVVSRGNGSSLRRAGIFRLRTAKQTAVLRSGCCSERLPHISSVEGGVSSGGTQSTAALSADTLRAGALSAVALSGVPPAVWAERIRRAPERFSRATFVLLIYLLGYLLVHVTFTFQAWDRYVLPILPLVCILCGACLVAGWDWLRSRVGVAARRWAVVGLGAGLVYAASLGVTASIPVGSDIGAYRGVAEAARFLATEPPGAIVYYDRIGWHLGYYLYGRAITRSWYDSPLKLASETLRVANEQAGAAQWLALPAWEESYLPSLMDALAAKGFVARPAYEVAARNGLAEVTLYRLEPDDAVAQAGDSAGDGHATDGLVIVRVGRAEGKP